jgi:hypothetical protein
VFKDYFLENRLIMTTNRTIPTTQITVQSHIPPPSHPFMCPVD